MDIRAILGGWASTLWYYMLMSCYVWYDHVIVRHMAVDYVNCIGCSIAEFLDVLLLWHGDGYLTALIHLLCILLYVVFLLSLDSQVCGWPACTNRWRTDQLRVRRAWSDYTCWAMAQRSIACVLSLDDYDVLIELKYINNLYVNVYRFKLGIPVTLKF